MEHKTIRENDEYFCPKCGKRWDINEVAPTCLSRRENGLKQIAKLRKQYGSN